MSPEAEGSHYFDRLFRAELSQTRWDLTNLEKEIKGKPSLRCINRALKKYNIYYSERKATPDLDL